MWVAGLTVTLGLLVIVWLLHTASESSYCAKHVDEVGSMFRCSQFYRQ